MFNHDILELSSVNRFGGRIYVLAMAMAIGGCAATPPKTVNVQANKAKPELTEVTDPEEDPDLSPIELVETHREDGSLASTAEGWRDVDGNFVHHGKLTIFWESGEKKTEVHYFNGQYHGSKKSWYRSGQLWNQGQSIHGKPVGVWSEWHVNGTKARDMTFIKGGLNGWMNQWYPDGQIRHKVMYVKGLRQGRETRWDIDGALLRQSDYLDDVMQP